MKFSINWAAVIVLPSLPPEFLTSATSDSLYFLIVSSFGSCQIFSSASLAAARTFSYSSWSFVTAPV